MRGPVIASVVFHIVIFLVTYFGLPDFNRSLDLPPPPVFVEMVSEEELAALEEAPKPEPKPVPQQKAPPPPPPLPPAPTPAPEPEPEPEVEPEPEPEAEPVPEEVKKPEPKKPEPKPKPAPVVKQPRPSAKPQEPQQAKKPEKPKNDLASVLKTVQKLEDTPQPKPEPEEKKEDKKELALADILKNAQKPKANTQTPRRQVRDASELLSSSELDAVKRQIANCWSIQPGARNAEDLIVKLRVTMNPDRTVRTVEVIKGSGGNPFQGAAERSAQAAVYKCSPLRLPADKYDVWNIINFTFDPKQMFG